MLHDQLIEKVIQFNEAWGYPETTVDEVMELCRVDRSNAVEILKKLTQRGLGEFKIGRGASGDFKTRIVWNQRIQDPSASRPVVSGPIDEGIERKRDIKVVEAERQLTTYVFPLDQDKDIKLELPRNLTLQEADRIGLFVKSLVRQ